MTSIAYHLRQDGKCFPITAHIYCSKDGTLMGEAEAAEFIIATESRGISLAKKVLDTWTGLMLLKRYSMAPDTLNVDNLILSVISNTQNLMEYRISDDAILSIHHELNNFSTMAELKTYLDSVDIKRLQSDMAALLNQQFCRVRYGGIYDSHGDPELWIRISSVGVYWTNVIYQFVTEFKNMQKVELITICKDRTTPDSSPNSYANIDDSIKVYKADDGELYLHMPIDEYLSKTHSMRGAYTATDTDICFADKWHGYIWDMLGKGYMLHEVLAALCGYGIDLDTSEIWDILTQAELTKCI